VGVRLTAKFGGASAKQFAGGFEMHMHFKTDYGFPGWNICAGITHNLLLYKKTRLWYSVKHMLL
jgi:hypothetical protein